MLRPRTMTDRLGLPMGLVQHWREDWCGNDLTAKTAVANGAWGGRWTYGISVAGANNGQLQVLQPTGPIRESAMVELAVNGPTATAVVVEHTRSLVSTTPNVALAMQWDAVSLDSIVNDGEQAMGIRSGSLATNVLDIATIDPTGVYFFSGVATATWWFYVKAPGGVRVGVNTGVSNAVDTRQRFRIEVEGSSAAEDGVARVNGYIQGSKVASLAADMAASGGDSFNPFFRERGLASRRCYIGHVAFASALWPASVLT